MHTRFRSIMLISACWAVVSLPGCHGAASHTYTQAPNGNASPPQVGDQLESFSFSSLSGESLTWDAQRSTLTAGTEQDQPTAMFLHVFQPDCHKCQALAGALQRLVNEEHAEKPTAVGVTHRGDEQATIDFVRDTGASYPIAVGTGSRWAHTWGRGDPLYVVDRHGRVVYSQVGYENGDPKVWRKVLADLVADRTMRFTHPGREGLRAGDILPALKLPDQLSDRGMSLTSGGNGLLFTNADGREHRYRASIGFFSRY